jgi:uncharacterized LabA/DUF88 family protein
MNRTVFLIDGFNLYHSVREASRDLRGASTKWLDIASLCKSYLYLIGNNAQVTGIHYFSALARHLEASNPDVTKRHQAFIRCLEATGITCQLNRFKAKTINCPYCRRDFLRHEEKETDVAISIKLIELFHRDECDTIVLLTGDTDIAPAVRTSLILFPDKEIWFAFPYKRTNHELKKLVNRSIKISKDHYTRYQLPSPFTLPDGTQITKPSRW